MRVFRKTFAALMIICILLLTGCSENTEKKSYHFTDKKTESDNVSYTYPEIAADGMDTEAINKLIENYVLERCKKGIYEDNTDISLEGKYSVSYSGNDFISIKFTELYYKQSWAHPTLVCTGLVIDINDKKTEILENFGIGASQLLKWIEDGDYEVDDGGFKEFTQQEILEHVQSDIDSGKINLGGDCFYIGENDIYIIFNTLVHALGDYSIIKIPRVRN